MAPLRLLVYLRESPAGDSRLEPTRDRRWIDEERLSWEPAEADATALAWALHLQETHDCHLTVCSLGPPRVESMLRRTALALEVDRAVHVIDERGLRISPAERAWLLAAVARRERADLVLLGAYSDDWGTGVTAPFAARYLGWPVALQVAELHLEESGTALEATCEAGSSERRVDRYSVPCVVSLLPGRITLRHPTLRGILAAGKKPVERLERAELPAPPPELPRFDVRTLRPLERRRNGHTIQDVDEGVEAVWAELRRTAEAPAASSLPKASVPRPRAKVSGGETAAAFRPTGEGLRPFAPSRAAWIDAVAQTASEPASGREFPPWTRPNELEVIRLVSPPQETTPGSSQPARPPRRGVTVEFPNPVAARLEEAACAVAELTRERELSVLLFPRGPRAEDLSSLVAAQRQACLVRGIPAGMEPSTGGLVFSVPLFRGKLVGEVVVPPDQPLVAALEGSPLPASAEVPPESPSGVSSSVVLSADRYRCPWPVPPAARRLEAALVRTDWTHAPIVFGIGRGVAERNLFERIARLAESLGAELVGTRPVVDRGWLSRDRQVGSSGQLIRPALYLALGISGAYQHIIGVMEAETIVAVNRDPQAPILRMADLGIVAPVEAFVTRLEARIGRDG